MNAIITGATRGIGRALTFKLAEMGYHLAIGARQATELEALCTELQEKHPELEVYARVTDCARAEEVQAFAEAARLQFKHIDVLINNVGQYIPGGLLEESEEALEQQMQVNVYAAHRLSKFFGRHMRDAGRGHIINIVSVAGIAPFAAAASYSVTKYAMQGLTHVLREELKPAGVKVTAVIPGATLTSSWAGTMIPAEHFIQPEDVAAAVAACLQLSPGANVDELIIRPNSTLL